MPFKGDDLIGRKIVLEIGDNIKIEGVGYLASWPLIVFAERIPPLPCTADVRIGNDIFFNLDIRKEDFAGRKFICLKQSREDIPSRP